eukprot:s10672_g2.t1
MIPHGDIHMALNDHAEEQESGAAGALGSSSFRLGVLNGDLESSELENDEVLCLLSLQDQTQLGLCKDLRSGGSHLPTDFPDVWLPVARHVRTSLLLLNVSSFKKDPNRHHRAFRSETEEPVQEPEGRDATLQS